MPATGARWSGRSHPGDLTGNRGRQLKAQADLRAQRAEAAQQAEAQRSAHRTPAELVAETQARLPRGVASWDSEINDVVVDYSAYR
ncbi:MAG: hypothetical protein ACRDNZ_14240 [Streptosporangiaceae bacterium]